MELNTTTACEDVDITDEIASLLSDEVEHMKYVKEGLLNLQKVYGSNASLQHAIRLANDQLDLTYMCLVNIRSVAMFVTTAGGKAKGEIKLAPHNGD